MPLLPLTPLVFVVLMPSEREPFDLPPAVAEAALTMAQEHLAYAVARAQLYGRLADKQCLILAAEEQAWRVCVWERLAQIAHTHDRPDTPLTLSAAERADLVKLLGEERVRRCDWPAPLPWWTFRVLP